MHLLFLDHCQQSLACVPAPELVWLSFIWIVKLRCFHILLQTRPPELRLGCVDLGLLLGFRGRVTDFLLVLFLADGDALELVDEVLCSEAIALRTQEVVKLPLRSHLVYLHALLRACKGLFEDLVVLSFFALLLSALDLLLID